MPHRAFTLEQLAAYLHISRDAAERLVRETDIPHAQRGGRLLFQRGEIDAWASQRILGMPDKRLDAYHEQSMRGTREIFPDDALIPQLLAPGSIDLALTSKTKASVLRDLVKLGERTGHVLDSKELLGSMQEREALGSTALPGGIALLHARHHAEYRFDTSFLALGRTVQAVPFGAPDGQPTQIFFLIGCEDERIHLHTLARLCLLAVKTKVIDRLFEVETADEAYDVLVTAEQQVLPGGRKPKAEG
jgi:excisionase family DNA binding protein